MIRLFALLIPLFFLAACKDDITAQALPQPIVLTEEAAGHYCQMVILEHQGPKAQLYLAGYPAPLWFSQIRDAVAYVKSPEQTAEILVIYVNDMGQAISWSEPGDANWIAAKDAHFVVGSDAIGGMGAPEIVPFSDAALAQQFAREHGGEVMTLTEIPAELVLSPIEFNTATLETN